MKTMQHRIAGSIILAVLAGSGCRQAIAPVDEKKIEERAVNRYLENLRATRVADEAFTTAYFAAYETLNAIMDAIKADLADIWEYKQKIAVGDDLDKLGESVLILRAAESGRTALWAILYGTDIIGIYAKTPDQLTDYGYLSGRLNDVMGAIAYSVTDLENITSLSNDTARQMTYTHLRDKIREAQGILERLRTTLQNKHDALTRKSGPA